VPGPQGFRKVAAQGRSAQSARPDRTTRRRVMRTANPNPSNAPSNALRKATFVLIAFGLLLCGSLGVAFAAPSAPPVSPDSLVVEERTDRADLATTREPTTRAAISYRHLWCGINGDVQLNLTGLGAANGQPVAVTIAEAGTSESEWIGSARMRVNNVAVWGDSVSVWVTVEWGAPLCVYTHYLAI
jgi:hypothetical protein